MLVHCSLAHAGAWDGLVRAAGWDDVLRVELPGHGRAPDWDGGPYLAQARGLVLKALRDGPAHLVGHSFGGVAALAAALELPGVVSRLSLIEPVLFAAAAPEQRAAGDAAFAPFAEAWRAGDRESAARAFLSVWGGGMPWDAMPEPVRRYAVDRIHLIPAADADLNADREGLIPRLGSLAVPVDLIGGSRSPAVAGIILDELAERLPDARRAVVEGAGHMAPISHSQEVAGFL
ncbi:pimeloyl-ACP methyl ester carboxylesterase [Hasllibacter halocynthiae]|uniref:Pimeloyl-ACP methyl ester carboxylesterase n=1 Tax=Hasllibacter halocynthiae TaxID=595589 RepID=A0A2T0X171_9RHOB|nr:alpha/beta fold hydrolase [Hasllibacter halocynthiae]PRY92604.1 pimeloyl-ACP methyl ester carboxylesterase [Hasllibacter halocynthiae]